MGQARLRKSGATSARLGKRTRSGILENDKWSANLVRVSNKHPGERSIDGQRAGDLRRYRSLDSGRERNRLVSRSRGIWCSHTRRSKHPGGPGSAADARINATVKKRQSFGPFAPAVTIEQVDRWFDVAPMTALSYMTFTVDVREEQRAALPAITHINGSASVQTASRAENPDIHTLLSEHTLLREVGESMGREMDLTTSFNVKGPPIVNTAAEAVESFLETDMDALFLENIRVERKAS